MNTSAEDTISPLSQDEFERLMWAMHFGRYCSLDHTDDTTILKQAALHGPAIRDSLLRTCFLGSTSFWLGPTVRFLADHYSEKPETAFFRRRSVVDSHGEDGMETMDALRRLKMEDQLGALEEKAILRNALAGRSMGGRSVGKDLGPTCRKWYFREATLTPVVLGQWLGSQTGGGFSADFRYALYRSGVTSLGEYCLESFGADADAFVAQLGSRKERRLTDFLPPPSQAWWDFDPERILLNPQTSPDEIADLIQLASAEDIHGHNRYRLWRGLVARAHPATQIDEWARTFQPPEAHHRYWLWTLAEHHPCPERALTAFRELMESEHRETYYSLALRGCLSRQKGLSEADKQSFALLGLRASQEVDMDSIWRFLADQTELSEELVDEIMKKIPKKAEFTSKDLSMLSVMQRLLEMGLHSPQLLDQCAAAASKGLFQPPWNRTGPFLLCWAKAEPTIDALKKFLSELDSENHAGQYALVVSFAVGIGAAWNAEKLDAAIEAINGCGLCDSTLRYIRGQLFDEIAFFLRHQSQAQEWLLSRTETDSQSEWLRSYFRQVAHEYQWDSTEDAWKQTLREVNDGKPGWYWANSLAFWHGERPEIKAFLTLAASRGIGPAGSYEARKIKRAARKALFLRWPNEPDVQDMLLQTLTSPTEEGDDDLLNEAAYLGSLFFADAQRWHNLLKLNAKRSEGCLFEYLVGCLSSGRQAEALEFVHELLRDLSFWESGKRWLEQIPHMILQLLGPRWDILTDVKALTAEGISSYLQRELLNFLNSVMPKSLGGNLEHEIDQIRLDAVRAAEISTEMSANLREMLTQDPSREVRCAVAEKLVRHQPDCGLKFADIRPLLSVEDSLTISILNLWFETRPESWAEVLAAYQAPGWSRGVRCAVAEKLARHQPACGLKFADIRSLLSVEDSLTDSILSLWCETRPESWREVLAAYQAPECSARTPYAKALAKYFPLIPHVREALRLRLMEDSSKEECSVIIKEWCAKGQFPELTEHTLKFFLWHEKLDAYTASACAEQLIKEAGVSAALSLFKSWHDEANETDQWSLRVSIATQVACLPTKKDFHDSSPLALEVTAWLTASLAKAHTGNEYRGLHSALLMSFFQKTPAPKRRSNPVYEAAQNALMALYSKSYPSQPE